MPCIVTCLGLMPFGSHNDFPPFEKNG